MIVAVHQPQYLPWLGYFDKMAKADIFCYLDNVQYKKNEWQNRNRIKTAQGWQWLTVPVTYRFPEKIGQVRINRNMAWEKKHLKAISTSYGRAPFFSRYMELIRPVILSDHDELSTLNIALAEALRQALKIDTRTVVVSQLPAMRENPTDRLIDICRHFGADTYLAGQGGTNYMDVDRFDGSGVKVAVQHYEHPVYPQLFGKFISHLSVIDLIFNCGPGSAAVIGKGA
jgi:hypothetical protein